MFYNKIYLKDIDKRFENTSSFLRIYISEQNERVSLRPGLLICPGGGYSFCSEREAEPVAFRFLSEGFNCFILNYSVNSKYPTPHLDLALAISFIRDHEKEFDLLPNSLSIIGFSAGGHLVGSYSYLFKELANTFNFSLEKLKPLCIVLAYPVISTEDKYTHKETTQIICGGEVCLKEKLNIYTHIDSSFPPTFIWTTKTDRSVPFENSLLLKEALKKNNVLHKLVLFNNGFHGGSLVNYSCFRPSEIPQNMVNVRDWVLLATEFIYEILKKNFYIG